MQFSFVERIATPLLFTVDLSKLCEPHTELGLWNSNRDLFKNFAAKLSAQEQALSIIEIDRQIYGRDCQKFPKWIKDSDSGMLILTELCAWTLCCAVFNFLYTNTDKLVK